MVLTRASTRRAASSSGAHLIVIPAQRKVVNGASLKKKEVRPLTVDNHESTSDDENDEEDEGEDVESDDDEDDDDDYFLDPPEVLQKNTRVRELYNDVKEMIRNDRTPDLETLLTSTITKAHKADLLEMFVMFSNAEPYTEEYYHYRNTYNRMYTTYMKDDTYMTDEVRDLPQRTSNDISLQRIVAIDAPLDTKRVLYEKYTELCDMSSSHDEEYGKLKRWLSYALSLPYRKVIRPWDGHSSLTIYLQHVRRVLDTRLYGMKEVKEQIMLMLHSKLRNSDLTGCSLGLIGPPGVGKTTIARCLAEVLSYPFQHIPCGGLQHSEVLKGHQYTYIGSEPGEIAQCLMRMGYSNGILFFDEYEKVTQNTEMTSTLLHMTDPSQNMAFRDNYLSEIDIDLSRIWFMYSMNELPEDSALSDRIFPIHIQGYTSQEKVHIIVNYLFPKHLVQNGFGVGDLVVDTGLAQYIIDTIHDTDKGVRRAERAVSDVCRKVSYMYHHPEDAKAMSFAVHERVTLPYTLSRTMIDGCLRTFDRRGKETAHWYI